MLRNPKINTSWYWEQCKRRKFIFFKYACCFSSIFLSIYQICVMSDHSQRTCKQCKPYSRVGEMQLLGYHPFGKGSSNVISNILFLSPLWSMHLQKQIKEQ